MISVKQAQALILANTKPLGITRIPLAKCDGRVLRENIYADRDQPACDRATMDGIALRYRELTSGVRRLRIAGTQKAGIPAQTLKTSRSCYEIMTGAVMPHGSDCVIPVEKVRIEKGWAVLDSSIRATPREHVHRQGQDYRRRALLLKAGTYLDAQQIALAAAAGKKQLPVTVSPQIAIIGTGDELIDVGRPIKYFQVRRSNAYTLQAICRSAGYPNARRFHLPDNKKILETKLRRILNNFNILILSGGVSMGKFDLVPQVLAELKVKNIFHKVAQRPGKPLWFGKVAGGALVFGLPGNPVSTQICAYRYVLPALAKASAGILAKPSWAVLSRPVKIKSDLTQFIPVAIKNNAGVIQSTALAFSGSGDFAALSRAQGFVELPPGTKSYPAGKVVQLFYW